MSMMIIVKMYRRVYYVNHENQKQKDYIDEEYNVDGNGADDWFFSNPFTSPLVT